MLNCHRVQQHSGFPNTFLKFILQVLMDVVGPKVRIKRLTTSVMNPVVNPGYSFFLTGSPVIDNFHGMNIACECSTPEFLLEGLSALNDILVRMQEHQYKKTPKLRALNIAKKSLELNKKNNIT